MRSRSAVVIAVIVLASLATNAWSQNPITADSPFQLRYFANLNVGDSVVNMTNTGATGGNICVNTYVFHPDETMAACCSCVVPPNGLASYSVRNDLISNTLTPAVPTSVVVKLAATTGGACNAAAPGALAVGLLAWGTSLHSTTTTTTAPNTSATCVKYCKGGYPAWASWCNANCKPKTVTSTINGLTETPFSPATLSAFELALLSDRCMDIQQNGAGYGICRSCGLGGQ